MPVSYVAILIAVFLLIIIWDKTVEHKTIKYNLELINKNFSALEINNINSIIASIDSMKVSQKEIAQSHKDCLNNLKQELDNLKIFIAER